MSLGRMREVFLDLLKAESPFLHEAASAKIIKDYLDAHSLPWQEDSSAAKTGASCGNIIVAGRGDARLSFYAHMDTIKIYEPFQIQEEETLIKARGGGVIGADDKAGVAVQLEALALLRENGLLKDDIHFIFTTSEEEGFRGIKQLEERHFINAFNFVNDSGGLPVGRCVNRGVGQDSFRVEITGRMSHTGGTEGKNAVVFAAGLLATLKTGKLSDSLFVNISGTESRGNPNTVPDWAAITGQVLYSSREEADAAVRALEEEAKARAAAEGYSCVFEIIRDCPPLNTPENAPIVGYAREAAERACLAFSLGQTGSGSDAHVIAQRGGAVLKISSGMRNVHSRQECVDLKHMFENVRFVCALADSGNLAYAFK